VIFFILIPQSFCFYRNELYKKSTLGWRVAHAARSSAQAGIQAVIIRPELTVVFRVFQAPGTM
jgi:hypothetical protein